MEKAIDENLCKYKFEFRKNIGTGEAIITFRILIEKRISSNKDTLIAFVDSEKAFDNVQRNVLLDIQKIKIQIQIGIKYYDRRCIYKSYKN